MIHTLNDPDYVQKQLNSIRQLTPRPIRIMEVCGTHTHAVSRFSFRQTLNGYVDFLSGPGCPVCVTTQTDIDKMIAYANLPNTIITTFGDMMRVPGSSSSLTRAKAEGADIRVVFSPLDSLKIAQDNPSRYIIFIGVGFETTIPVVAASIKLAQNMNLNNYSVLSFHKTVPEALNTLFSQSHKIDGLMLPGHVAAVLGLEPFSFLVDKFNLPSVVTGFTPVEILHSVETLAGMIQSKDSRLVNAYPRVVKEDGNIHAKKEITDVFFSVDAQWRGLGWIPSSGLKIRPKYQLWDAEYHFLPKFSGSNTATQCCCGAIITGQLKPVECPLFKNVCTPENPQGPCMVSGEGACAAFYQYDRHYLELEAE